MLDDKKKIAERLRKARENAGLTQQQLADQANLGRSAVMHYENEKAVPGSMELIRLAKALNVSPNFILVGSEEFGEPNKLEHALATENQEALIARTTLCLLALEPEVRKQVSELVMTLVKQRLSKSDYEEFVKQIEQTLLPTLAELNPEIEDLVEQNMKGKK